MCQFYMLLSYSEERVEYEHVLLYHGHDLVQGFRSDVAQLRVVQHDPPAVFRAARASPCRFRKARIFSASFISM